MYFTLLFCVGHFDAESCLCRHLAGIELSCVWRHFRNIKSANSEGAVFGDRRKEIWTFKIRANTDHLVDEARDEGILQSRVEHLSTCQYVSLYRKMTIITYPNHVYLRPGHMVTTLISAKHKIHINKLLLKFEHVGIPGLSIFLYLPSQTYANQTRFKLGLIYIHVLECL